MSTLNTSAAAPVSAASAITGSSSSTSGTAGTGTAPTPSASSSSSSSSTSATKKTVKRAPSHNTALWYDTPGYADLALAIPNWGSNPTTQNSEILDLVTMLGQQTQAIMFTNDARVAAPPTQNTVGKIVQMCESFFSLIATRYVPEATGVTGIEQPHTSTDIQPFLVYPTPLFNAANRWMKKMAAVSLMVQSELMRNSENGRSTYLSQVLASLAVRPIHMIYARVAIEMLGVPTLGMVTLGDGSKVFSDQDPRSLNFLLTPAQKDNYAPSQRFTMLENVSVAPATVIVPDETDIEFLTAGIAVNSLPSTVKPWPTAIPTFTTPDPTAPTSVTTAGSTASGTTSGLPAASGSGTAAGGTSAGTAVAGTN